jgi:hypothetical protein
VRIKGEVSNYFTGTGTTLWTPPHNYTHTEMTTWLNQHTQSVPRRATTKDYSRY